MISSYTTTSSFVSNYTSTLTATSIFGDNLTSLSTNTYSDPPVTSYGSTSYTNYDLNTSYGNSYLSSVSAPTAIEVKPPVTSAPSSSLFGAISSFFDVGVTTTTTASTTLTSSVYVPASSSFSLNSSLSSSAYNPTSSYNVLSSYNPPSTLGILGHSPIPEEDLEIETMYEETNLETSDIYTPCTTSLADNKYLDNLNGYNMTAYDSNGLSNSYNMTTSYDSNIFDSSYTVTTSYDPNGLSSTYNVTSSYETSTNLSSSYNVTSSYETPIDITTSYNVTSPYETPIDITSSYNVTSSYETPIDVTSSYNVTSSYETPIDITSSYNLTSSNGSSGYVASLSDPYFTRPLIYEDEKIEEEYREDYEEGVEPVPLTGDLDYNYTSMTTSITTAPTTASIDYFYENSTYPMTTKLSTIPETANDIYLSSTDLQEEPEQFGEQLTTPGAYDYTENENDYIASGDLKDTNLCPTTYASQPPLTSYQATAVSNHVTTTANPNQQPQPERKSRFGFGSFLSDGLNAIGSSVNTIKSTATNLAGGAVGVVGGVVGAAAAAAQSAQSSSQNTSQNPPHVQTLGQDTSFGNPSASQNSMKLTKQVSQIYEEQQEVYMDQYGAKQQQVKLDRNL